MARVVLLGLDGFPHRAIRPDLTPRMWALAAAGGRAPDGGVTDLPSSTDPGYCSLLTGCLPKTHGVRTTAWRYVKLPDWVGLETPRVPSIFDACRRGGISSVAFVGDDRGLLCTWSADECWPPATGIPAGTALDAHGYPANRSVLPHLLRAAANPTIGFIFGHLNESDTIGHDHGPESAAAQSCYAATDTQVGRLLDALQDAWDETVVMIVSDHDMQARTASAPIDLMPDGPTRFWDAVVPDGGAALIHPLAGVEPAAVSSALAVIDGVESSAQAGSELFIAGARPGRIFASPVLPSGGFHGAPVTARTVAIVGGGHPAVRRIARSIEARRPHLSDWMPTIASLLDLQVGGLDGHDLLQSSATG